MLGYDCAKIHQLIRMIFNKKLDFIKNEGLFP